MCSTSMARTLGWPSDGAVESAKRCAKAIRGAIARRASVPARGRIGARHRRRRRLGPRRGRHLARGRLARRRAGSSARPSCETAREGWSPCVADLTDPDDVARAVRARRRRARRAAARAREPRRRLRRRAAGGRRRRSTPSSACSRSTCARPTSSRQAALPRLRRDGRRRDRLRRPRAPRSQPFAGAAGYAASKAAVLAFAKAVGAEEAADGVRCNAIVPTHDRHAGQPRGDAGVRAPQARAARADRARRALPASPATAPPSTARESSFEGIASQSLKRGAKRLRLARRVVFRAMDRKWWTLLAVCVATFMLLLDVTIVNVALPYIERDLHSSFSDLQWVVDAYALTLAALLLTAGSLGRPPRAAARSSSLGLVIFTGASALCGFAGSPLMLNLSRGLQGDRRRVHVRHRARAARRRVPAGRSAARRSGCGARRPARAVAVGPAGRRCSRAGDRLGGDLLRQRADRDRRDRADAREGRRVARPEPGAARLGRHRDCSPAALFLLVFGLIRGNAGGLERHDRRLSRRCGACCWSRSWSSSCAVAADARPRRCSASPRSWARRSPRSCCRRRCSRCSCT